ncbi:hypothetical protein JCGZ_05977 [Jatropha curcas]|uniref:Uncharacterized protein n=1 Tax=Jatropha curcas TaxID=180498 RepID=A0A067KR93_JATCU|nr:hypothetical protein JCGZ_05977 [Jatropha curcas]
MPLSSPAMGRAHFCKIRPSGTQNEMVYREVCPDGLDALPEPDFVAKRLDRWMDCAMVIFSAFCDYLVLVGGFNWGYFNRPSTITTFDCVMVIVDDFYDYLALVGSFNWGYFVRPNTIMAFDRWTDCAMLIISNFCGYLSPVGIFGLRMLHFGRLSFERPGFSNAALREIHLTRARHYSCSEGSTTTDHLAAFMPGTYAIFDWTHLPPPTEFDPFTEAKELDRGHDDALRDKRMRESSDSRAPDTNVVVGKPEHGLGASFSFILDCTGQPAQGMLETHLVFIADYNEVSQLYKAARLKLAVARLFDEHISRTSMAPPEDRGWGAQHGGHASPRPIIIEESKESGSEDSEETESNMS